MKPTPCLLFDAGWTTAFSFYERALADKLAGRHGRVTRHAVLLHS